MGSVLPLVAGNGNATSPTLATTTKKKRAARTVVVPSGVGDSSVGVLGVVEVLEGGGGDPPVQGLESLLDGGVLQDLHLPRQQTLQLDLRGGVTEARKAFKGGTVW